MRFSVEVRRNADGRLEGTIGVAGERDVPFSGVIELVGLIEAHLDAAAGTSGRPGGTDGRAAGVEA